MIAEGLIERECVPYFEGVQDKYERIGKMFWIGHPEQVINPLTAAPVDKAILMYGLALQARFGDNKEPEPSKLNLLEHQKWSAWNEWKGTDINEA